MGRTARSSRDLPHPKPVQKIQLSEDAPTYRLIAAGLLLLLGAGALAYALLRLLAPEAGWKAIQASAAGGPTCAEEFVFLYELGADGRSAGAEDRALSAKYTEVCRKAFQLFHTNESFEGMVNLREISRRPNEILEVDRVLWQAFAAVQEHGDRTVYLGPVYARYGDLFYCTDDAQLTDFDPYLSEEVRQEYAEAAAYAMDPRHVEVEVLEDSRICLRVSEEYLAYAQREGIDRFLDFGWMKNAFIVDYLAQTMMEEGFTHGCITSYDGFSRCLDDRTLGYSLNLYDYERSAGQPVQVGTVEYQGPMSLISFRAFPVDVSDGQRSYQLRDGEVRTSYLDPRDGLCKNAVASMVCCSDSLSCAEMAMAAAPVFIAEAIDEGSLAGLEDKDVQYLYCQDKMLHASEGMPAVTGIRQGYVLGGP